MPIVDFQCRQCGCTFGRTALRGEPAPAADCPKCRSPETVPLQGPVSLFDGLTGFGDLAGNTD